PVGLAAAFAGVAAAFGVNFLVKPIDGILAEMTNDAAHIVDPAKSIELTANVYFGVASSVLLIVVCTVVTDWFVEPRLGQYQGSLPGMKGRACPRRSRAGCGSPWWLSQASSSCLSSWHCRLARRCETRKPRPSSETRRSWTAWFFSS